MLVWQPPTLNSHRHIVVDNNVAHGLGAEKSEPSAYLGLGLGLGLLVADTSYAPRGILNIVEGSGRVVQQCNVLFDVCVPQGEDTWVQGAGRIKNTSLKQRTAVGGVPRAGMLGGLWLCG